jgi:FkbM family methyltransferase
MYRTLRRAARRLKRRLRPPRDAAFMPLLRGVVHVGANTGQERGLYDSYRLPVVWIEPIPEVYAELRANLASYPEQRALCALIADRDGVAVDFHVANNSGVSSSMLELAQHRELWPDVSMSRTLKMVTTTLDALLRDGQIGPVGEYNALIMDTQGSELLVLQGAQALLGHIDIVKTEAADFESYVGCCRLDEIGAFMRERGFEEFSRRRFAEREGVGSYYDVVYRRLALDGR